MININNKITATPNAECVWHKIAMNDYLKRNMQMEGKPTFPKNNPCAMACNGYDFDCKNYDSIAKVRFIKGLKEKGFSGKVNNLEFFK